MSINAIIVVRHGQAKGNSAEDPLTPEGFVQAEEVAVFLHERFGHAGETIQIISSPYLRATQTATAISWKFNRSFQKDARLIERVLGDTSGQSEEEVWRKLEEHFEQSGLSFSGGESNLEVSVRVKEFLRDLEAGAHHGPILLITHRITMTLLLQQFHTAIGFKECREMTNPDVYLVDPAANGVSVKHIWNSALLV